ncbi:MAG: glycosyltransferase family 4 protein, partial [Cytophagales bacterium]|nr:glycosyltransferase family 4 protein [Cytophagales bacterium]
SFIFPSFFSASERARRAVAYMTSIDQADAVVTSYEHIRQDIIRFFAKKPEQVLTVPVPLDEKMLATALSPTALASHHPRGNFLLYPAATWPHKNHSRLISALHLLKQKQGTSLPLVCTGHLTPHAESLKRELAQLKLSDSVQFLGIVSHQELHRLYAQCRAVVIPTLYEAGSFPLYESILFDAPVICSGVTSLPETIGDDRFCFNPLDPADIAQKIELIYWDEGFRESNALTRKRMRNKLKEHNRPENWGRLYTQLAG